VKRETISHLQESGADSALLEFLQADLVTYEHSKQQGPIDACPWIPQQQVMNYLDEAKLSSMSRPRLRVWRSRNVGESLKESMQKGCNICMRICEAVDCLGYDYSDIDIDSQYVSPTCQLRFLFPTSYKYGKRLKRTLSCYPRWALGIVTSAPLACCTESHSTPWRY
jgi:hypothetical protein